MNENLSLTHEELLICERLRSLRMSGAISGLQQTVLRSKTDAMRSERT